MPVICKNTCPVVTKFSFKKGKEEYLYTMYISNRSGMDHTVFS